MKRNRKVFLAVLALVMFWTLVYWFAGRQEVYSAAAEKAYAVEYSYLDHMGRISTDIISNYDEVSEVLEAVKSIDGTAPRRIIRPEDRSTTMVISFTLLDENGNEIRSYSVHGPYLAVGQKDTRHVTVYSCSDRELSALRDLFINRQ